MKKNNYILIAIITAVIVFTPLNAKALEIESKEIPFTVEELQTKIEWIKTQSKYKNNASSFKNYLIIYSNDTDAPLLTTYGKDALILCGLPQKNYTKLETDTNKDRFKFECTKAIYSIIKDSPYVWDNATNNITLKLKYLNYVVDTNVSLNIYEDITDANNKVLYKAGENILKYTYFNQRPPEEEIIKLPAITQQPVNCWFPFFLNKTSFDNFITSNYNLDPNTENMVILYISINIILLLIFLKILKKYLYHVAHRFGVI